MRGYIRRHRAGYRVEIHMGYAPDGTRLRHNKTLSNKKAAEKSSAISWTNLRRRAASGREALRRSNLTFGDG